MCNHVFLASKRECREIPYAERSDDRSRFPDHHDIDLFVVKHPERTGFSGSVRGLTLPYQYLVGIMGCGCGFSFDLPANRWADDGWTLNNHSQLSDYVEECLQDTDVIELRSMLAGDPDFYSPMKQRSIILEELRSPQFFFDEWQLTRVYKDRVSMPATVG